MKEGVMKLVEIIRWFEGIDPGLLRLIMHGRVLGLIMESEIK